MDIGTAAANLNWLAIGIAAVSTFMVGGIWYGPVFGRAWMTEAGFDEEHLNKRNQTKIFAGTLIWNLVMAFNLAMFLGPKADVLFGLSAGFFTGFGFVAASLGVFYLFEEKRVRFLMINGGFAVVSFTVMGAIIGAMN